MRLVSYTIAAIAAVFMSPSLLWAQEEDEVPVAFAAQLEAAITTFFNDTYGGLVLVLGIVIGLEILIAGAKVVINIARSFVRSVRLTGV